MNWKYKIKLNPLVDKLTEEHDLSDLPSSYCPPAVTKALADEISKAPPLVKFADKMRKLTTVGEVNALLEEIVDTADEKSVWCGL